MNCPHCRHLIPEGCTDETCPICKGNLSLPLPPPLPERVKMSAEEKTFFWILFWMALLGAPLLTWAGAANARSGGFLFLPLVGALVAGFSLAKIYTKTPWALAGMWIVYTIMVLIIYVGILFVGCLVLAGTGALR